MKRLIVLILLVCSIFLTGCSTYWYQEGKSFNECKQDRDECVTELQKYYDLDHIDKPERDFMENCMIDKGYILLPEDKLPPRVKRQDPDRSFYWFTNGLAGTLE
jgi:hypothetical protein